MYEDYRVLFVDDEPNILNSLRRGLIEEEYFCHFASSGKEALEIIKKEKIAVIVTDMRMPEMNGLDLLIRVTEESPLTVKVVLSGYTQLPQILVTINQVDIFKFVTKPWALEDFVQIIRKSLDYYIIRDENANYKKVLEAKNKSYQNILKKINDIVEDAKKSRELLGICGKSILSFGKNSSLQERTSCQNILPLQEKLFELLSQTVTIQKKEMKTDEIADHISNYLFNLYPDGIIDQSYEVHEKQAVNLRMLETAIDALWMAFADEFRLHGFYSKIQSEDRFSLIMLAPNVVPEETQSSSNECSILDVKIELMQDALIQVLELCDIQFQIVKSKNNLIIELSLIT